MPEPSNSANLPIVDLAAFVRNDSLASREESARDLVDACKRYGFVYVKGHGVAQQEVDQAFAVSKKFYALPTAEKMKAPHPPGWAVHRGYSWPGLEKVSNALSQGDDKDLVEKLRQVQDYKESYEVGSDDNPEMPNIWPPDDVLPEWRPFMTEFYWTCWRAARTILQALAMGLGIDEELILRPHSGHCNQLRLLHYPSIPAEVVESGKFARMPAHTDWSTITLLFQDDCGGLQVENPACEGHFIDATPIEDTLILNVGDLLMRWSNDELKSTQHRVQLPTLQDRFDSKERLTRARYSIPYFVTTDPDVVIECLPMKEQNTAKYEPITRKDYNAMRARMQY